MCVVCQTAEIAILAAKLLPDTACEAVTAEWPIFQIIGLVGDLYEGQESDHSLQKHIMPGTYIT